MRYRDLKYDPRENKAVMFFSASSLTDVKEVYGFGIREILVSYHYISKSFKFFEEFIPRLVKVDKGLFMTDSGGFSFLANKEITPEMKKEEYWLEYLENYVQWLHDYREHIYVAANLDLDRIVGREIVDKWNMKYFKPLEKYMNIVYVAHRDLDGVYSDFNGLKRVNEYCKNFEYVGVSQYHKNWASQIYGIARQNKTRLHGFAWTSIPMLQSNPFFSVDSTTWLGGVRYGTSYCYDGKNFTVIDYKKKYVRKWDKVFCRDNDIDYELLMKEKRTVVNQYNLVSWLGARHEILKAANTKLSNKSVNFYRRYD